MIGRTLRIALLWIAAQAATTSASAQSLTLESTGGATLGGLTTLTVHGNPGDQYAIILSLTTGPTPLPPPHQPPTLDVGLELFALSISIPGFFGNLDASGAATAFLPIPFDVILLAIPPLNFQAIRIVNSAKIDGKSNLCRLVPALPQTTQPTLGQMSVLRAGHIDATSKLEDGSVIIFGGGPDGNVASFGQDSVDLYDPCTQTFTQVGTMLQPRTSHTATRLLDGRFLIVGGADAVLGEPTKTAEIYDPDTNTSVPAPDLPSARALHSASLLPDGRVIVMGGTSSFNSPSDIILNATDTTQIYDPATNSWSAGPTMFEPRVGHRVITLPDSRVLVTGGYSWFLFLGIKTPRISNSAELYTPGGGAGAFSAPITMQQSRFGHNAILASNGKVYLFGGATDQGSPLNPIAVDTIERFDIPTASFTMLPALMTKARGACALAQLPNNIIVVAGGSFGNLATPTPDDSVDLFDTTVEGVVATLQMQHVRSNFSATALDDGTVLFAGGGDDVDPGTGDLISFGDAEIFHP